MISSISTWSSRTKRSKTHLLLLNLSSIAYRIKFSSSTPLLTILRHTIVKSSKSASNYTKMAVLSQKKLMNKCSMVVTHTVKLSKRLLTSSSS